MLPVKKKDIVILSIDGIKDGITIVREPAKLPFNKKDLELLRQGKLLEYKEKYGEDLIEEVYFTVKKI